MKNTTKKLEKKIWTAPSIEDLDSKKSKSGPVINDPSEAAPYANMVS